MVSCLGKESNYKQETMVHRWEKWGHGRTKAGISDTWSLNRFWGREE